MPSWPILLSQAFNGLALGTLLALVSSGLTIILGTLGVLNFAHGALFTVGAYAAFVAAGYTDSFLLIILSGCAVMMVLGIVLERGIIRLFYNRPHEDQILVTYGIGIVLVETIRVVFGGNAQRVPVPWWGEGASRLGFLIYPTYRLELIFIIAALLLVLYLVLYRTSVGLVVRAGIENPKMVGILGIDLRPVFFLVFALGVTAVGLAGMLYAPVVAVTPDMGANFMVQSFVVIVLGGLGSFPGAVVGGILAGQIISLTSAFNSAYSEVMLYALMALLLVLRPQGLFGSEGRA
ncbi:branched-chain amino acid ABC transporter permease [Acuticoccus sediminis]|uniref:Branched-chain amino acid ABC transporter permease n=1 Tax=Acuticoccus sediminis TaxID=2184697 RepID=A0A8B2NRG0_9HYPH|nr:branched-chain amino acid ABC transporter permease [Acuticoccus sediminis]RAI02475.1 branched-chain amino acid ABC transporter permease [Acuticoccus sediminis]